MTTINLTDAKPGAGMDVHHRPSAPFYDSVEPQEFRAGQSSQTRLLMTLQSSSGERPWRS